MMTLTRLIIGLHIALSTVVATGAEVTPVACDPLAAIDSRTLSSRGADGKLTPPDGSGPVHARAVAMMFSWSGNKFSVAVDSARPNAGEFDTLRFDFTNKASSSARRP
ncbi:MAG: hypothetical protein H8E53_00605 [Planctomycetes bacterium]|nr:hypothetical protein [Planctomycetota bacterium]